MNTKVLLIGGITAATVLAGGWALAQTQGHEHGATGSAQHAQATGPHGKGHGRMHQGQGHQGQGRGQMHGQMHGQMQQKMQHMRGKHQHMTQGQGTTQPGTTQPAQPQGNTGSTHQH